MSQEKRSVKLVTMINCLSRLVNGRNPVVEICWESFSSLNKLMLCSLRSLATWQNKRKMILFTQKKANKKALQYSVFLKTKVFKSRSAVTNKSDHPPSSASNRSIISTQSRLLQPHLLSLLTQMTGSRFAICPPSVRSKRLHSN